MAQITETKSTHGVYNVIFGRDPQINPLQRVGELTIDSEIITLCVKRALLEEKGAQGTITITTLLTIALYPLIVLLLFFSIPYLLQNYIYILLTLLGVLLICFILSLIKYTQVNCYQRSSIEEIDRYGRTLSFVALKNDGKRERVVIYLTKLSELATVDTTLRNPITTLTSPIKVICSLDNSANDYLNIKDEYENSFLSGTIQFDYQTIKLTKKGYDDPQQKRRFKRVKLIITCITFGFLFFNLMLSVIFSRYFHLSDVYCLVPSVVGLFGILPIYILLNHKYGKSVPIDIAITGENIQFTNIIRNKGTFSLLISDSNEIKRCAFYTRNKEDADAIAAGFSRKTILINKAFPIIFTRLIGNLCDGFFANGSITIENNILTFTGRKYNQQPTTMRVWVILFFIYLGTTWLADMLFPIYFGSSIPIELRLPLVLFAPLPVIIVFGWMIHAITPLFTIHSSNCLLTEITDLYRLGRQIEFTAPSDNGLPSRYIVYTPKESDALSLLNLLKQTK